MKKLRLKNASGAAGGPRQPEEFGDFEDFEDFDEYDDYEDDYDVDGSRYREGDEDRRPRLIDEQFDHVCTLCNKQEKQRRECN